MRVPVAGTNPQKNVDNNKSPHTFPDMPEDIENKVSSSNQTDTATSGRESLAKIQNEASNDQVVLTPATSRCPSPVSSADTDMPILTPTSTHRSTTPTDSQNRQDRFEEEPSTVTYTTHSGGSTSTITLSSGTNRGNLCSQTNINRPLNLRSGSGTFTSLPPSQYDSVNINSSGLSFTRGGMTFNYGNGSNASTSTPPRPTNHATNAASTSSRTFRDQILTSRNLPDGASISDCRLKSCNGSNLRITDCAFQSCNFSNSTISDCSFSSSNLSRCNVNDCYFSSSCVSGGMVQDCSHSSSHVV